MIEMEITCADLTPVLSEVDGVTSVLSSEPAHSIFKIMDHSLYRGGLT